MFKKAVWKLILLLGDTSEDVAQANYLSNITITLTQLSVI